MSPEPAATPESLVQRARASAAAQVERQYQHLNWAGPRPRDRASLAAQVGAQPLPDAALAQADLATLRARLEARTLTRVDLVRLYLDRILRLDLDRLNSVIVVDPEALAEAGRADARAAAGHAPRTPLEGMPVLVKDNIGTRGPLPTTGGAWALREAVCDRDSTVVARLRAAGAIILGKTNLSEWANWTTDDMPNGFSSVGGQTHNAYGRFEVSGSSSGSAVAAAAGLCAAAIGSETWGSLISPASANGVTTLKPSLGMISRDRIIPITEAQDTAGPMARSVADLAAVMDMLAGPDDHDPETANAAAAARGFSAALNAGALRGVRVGIVRQSLDVDPEAGLWRERLRAGLRAAGAVPVDLSPTPIEQRLCREDFMAVAKYDFLHGVDAYLAATKAPFHSLAELVAWNAEDAAARVPWGQTLLVASAAQTLDEAAYRRARDRNRAVARAQIDALLREGDCALLAGVGSTSFVPFAVAGAPAAGVPLGLRTSGEPVGATLIGRYLDDVSVLAAAFALEQATRARIAPAL